MGMSADLPEKSQKRLHRVCSENKHTLFRQRDRGEAFQARGK